MESIETFENQGRYASKIEAGAKYFDNRYNDIYQIEKIKVVGDTAEVTCNYNRRGKVIECGNFILYHLDQKQHSKLINQL
jgi:hypothetical protein